MIPIPGPIRQPVPVVDDAPPAALPAVVGRALAADLPDDLADDLADGPDRHRAARRWRRRRTGFARVLRGHVRGGRLRLDAALRGLRAAEVEALRALWTGGTASDMAVLSRCTAEITRRGRQLRTDLAVGAVDDAADPGVEVDLLGQVLLSDPAVGPPVAQRCGTSLPAQWWVVCTDDAPPGGEPRPARDPGRATARGGTACWLLPAPAAVPEPTGAAGREAVAVVGPVPASDLPDAVGRAVSTARLGAAAGVRGLVRATDVVLEETVLVDPDVRGRMRELLDRVGPGLVGTLEMLYDEDLSRSRVSDRLGVHRSTLEYRLRKVTELTGIDPTSTRGVQVFTTAISLRRAVR